MGVGLYLPATCEPLQAMGAESWLEQASGWFEENAGEAFEACSVGEDREQRPALRVWLHPCAENVDITAIGSDRLVASAKTSTVGPGYHIHVCELLRRFGNEMSVAWDAPDESEGTGDETGYFHTADGAAVEKEMLRWLAGVASVVVQQFDQGYELTMVSMPINDYQYPEEQDTITPLGPRTIDWFRGARQDPGSHVDIFPWWDAGLGADFYVGRALVRMWQEIRWRCPFSEEEFLAQRGVLRDLQAAYQLDSARGYPWREWDELLQCFTISGEFDDEDLPPDELRKLISEKAAAAKGERLIGYRRRQVRVNISGGWSVVIPGLMAEQWEDDDRSWSAWDQQRTVWISTFSMNDRDGQPPPARHVLDALIADDTQGEPLEFAQHQLVGMAFWRPHEENGQGMWNLNSSAAVPGHGVICNLYVEDADDRDWAIATWQSLNHPEKTKEPDEPEN